MKKLIIAEDDKFLIRVYKAKLEKAGYEIYILETGEEVLEKTKELKPDIIILDFIMPKKDVFIALQELKADPVTKDIPIIGLTNLSQDEDKVKILGMGCDKFIVKSDNSFEKVLQEIESVVR